MNSKWELFKQDIRGKQVAVCGIGKNNVPVVYQLLSMGAKVTACDKRSKEQLGKTAEDLTAAGAELCLGDVYLNDLNRFDLILRTPGMKPHLPEFNEARKNGIKVSSEMELFFEYCPAPIYAVTGSDGKTTTTTIIAGLLEAAGKRVFLGGNIGNPLLPKMDEICDSDVAVVELSSFQLMLMQQKPTVAVITNVAPNHLDWHKDMDEYVAAKHNLIAYQDDTCRTVLNLDNKITASFGESAVAGDVQFFSRKNKPSIGAYLNNQNILCHISDDEEIPVMSAQDIKIPGVHNIENYLAAICAVWGTVSPETIKQYAKKFGGVKHRSELVRVLHGVKWYNDSIGSSPSRTMAGLQSFDRKVILIAGGYDKHIPYTPLGEVAKDTVKTAILLGATADAIEKAIREYSSLPVFRVANMEEAVKKAYELAENEDIVFMSPASASFDMYKNFEERGEHFCSLVNKLV